MNLKNLAVKENMVTCYYGGKYAGRNIFPGDFHGKRYTFLRVINVNDKEEIQKKKVTVPEAYYQLLIKACPQQFVVVNDVVVQNVSHETLKKIELKRKPGRPAREI